MIIGLNILAMGIAWLIWVPVAVMFLSIVVYLWVYCQSQIPRPPRFGAGGSKKQAAISKGHSKSENNLEDRRQNDDEDEEFDFIADASGLTARDFEDLKVVRERAKAKLEAESRVTKHVLAIIGTVFIAFVWIVIWGSVKSINSTDNFNSGFWVAVGFPYLAYCLIPWRWDKKGRLFLWSCFLCMGGLFFFVKDFNEAYNLAKLLMLPITGFIYFIGR